MTNKEILEYYLNNGLIETCVTCQLAKLPTRDKVLKDDLFQDISLALLEYDNERLNTIHSDNKMNAFISAILIRWLWSSTSPYYTLYKKFADKASGEITPELIDTLKDD